MGEEVGTMQFRVQGEQIKKEKRKREKERKKKERKKNEYKQKIYMYEKRKNMSMSKK
jgi:hypothetical protein